MGWIKNLWIKWIVKSLFESPAGKIAFNWINGHKTLTGRIISFVSIFILIIQTIFPTTPYIDQVNAQWLLISGWIVTEFGLEHSSYKLQQDAKKLAE